MSDLRLCEVRMSVRWSGPRSISIQSKRYSLYLEIDPSDPAKRWCRIELTEQEIKQLRENGLSVRRLGKKPEQETE